ncbi:AAA family ATPase, partial [Chlorobium phaeovibrioides]|uniref:AAA family ATPase n=1 Tax=Chlorobium phaeovibrioides TaxID=1094 RepID=UPI001F026442
SSLNKSTSDEHIKTLDEIPYELLTQLEVTMENFLDAMKEVEPSAIREFFVEVPNVRWEDVGGHEEVKQALREAVEWPVRYRELFRKTGTTPPKGVILYGKPGTGKTWLAKALATESGVNFISVKGPEIISRFIGESEKAVRELFRLAKQSAPTIIFLDEIDSLAPARGAGGSESSVTQRVISQFLTEMDGIEELKGVFVLAATNRIDLLDPALIRPGRFDLLYEVPPPDVLARVRIFEIHTKSMTLDDDVSISALAESTEGMSGADIEFICRKASMGAISACIALEAGGIDPLHVELRVRDSHFQEAVRLLSSRYRDNGE